jgi:nicotinamidase-related amidase
MPRHAVSKAENSVRARHGRRFAFEPSRTALLVIDMQREFFASFEDEPNPMLDIVPRVAALAALARKAGVRVIHTREGYAADMSDVSPFRATLDYVGYAGDLGRSLIRGEPSHDFLDEMRPAPGETVIDKAGFSAFYASGLDNVLRASGIDHLMLAGVTTQCCVHSTLRDAVDRGYWCLTVADCCAASEPALHEAALAIIAGEGHLFGWIADLADVQRAVNAATKPVTGSRSAAVKPRSSKPRPPRPAR